MLISRLTIVPGKGWLRGAVVICPARRCQYPASETIWMQPPFRSMNSPNSFKPNPPGIGPCFVVLRPSVAHLMASSGVRLRRLLSRIFWRMPIPRSATEKSRFFRAGKNCPQLNMPRFVCEWMTALLNISKTLSWLYPMCQG